MPRVLRTGSDDQVAPGTHALPFALRAQGQAVDFSETAGGHTWQYWSHQIGPMLLAIDRFFRRTP